MSSEPQPRQKPSRGLSITLKLVGLMVLTSGAIVLLLTSYFLNEQLQDAHAALDRKAATYGRLVSKEVRSAIAFDDRETAREVFDSMAQDQDVESMVLMTSKGDTLYSQGTPGAWVEKAKGGVTEQRVLDLGERIGVVSPVVSLEGPKGTLVIELSTRDLVANNQRMMRTAWTVAALALALAAVLAFFIARSLGRRLAQISSVAEAVTVGDLAHAPVKVEGRDEISVLAHAFNAMLAHIQALVQQIKKSAEEEQSRLEGLVRARTEQLNVRNADMRLVLDNVDQGFITVDLRGALAQERSAVIVRWLGEPTPNDSLFSWIERTFPGKGDFFRVAWDGLMEDWMPLEMRIDQLPREVHSRQFCYTFTYKPVFEGGELSKLLLVMSDITAQVERRRAEEEERELAQVVRKLMQDRSGFSDFVAEADELVASIADKGSEWQRLRLLHTLKGNAGIFGFTSLARMCHEIETAVHERGDAAVTQEEIEMLSRTWTRLRDKVASLTEARRESLEVSHRDYNMLVERIDSQAPTTQLRALVDAWKLESVNARLTRLGEYARGLAERLEKDPIEIKIEGNDVRLDPHAWTSVWQSLVHVVRNAVDHGLETRDERATLKKSATGQLRLRTSIESGVFRLDIEDDGRGIDWDRVMQAAKRRGLPHATSVDLREALMADGLSTRDQATDTSGRGVGLSAVKQIVQQTGGRMRITSEAGHGTRFAFEWVLDGARRPVLGPVVSAPANDVVVSEGVTKSRYVKAV